MASGNFFGGEFFGGGFFGFNPGTTGGKGDNEDVRRYRSIKPLGLPPSRKAGIKARQTPSERVDETAQIHAEVFDRLARELGEEAEQTLKAIEEMSQEEIAREIGERLRKKIAAENNQVILLLALIAGSV